ncbi:hypothetical protein ACSHWB_02610 [Lentzea sp. HUAS TT2]|uniref:hypothetical protein n=1 Tax=Lentzea sp. HUAS TT2 TaxID=3447454 RepID=UPI003F7200F6
MRRWGIVALVAAVLAALAWFAARPEGDSTTDDSAERAAECLARYPVPDSAAAFARRALDADSECRGWEVIEFTDIGNRLVDLEEPSARLVLRIHHGAFSGMWFQQAAITACYRMEFNYYGQAGGPSRVDCPPGAEALYPPGVRRGGVPENYADAFRQVLVALPPAPSRDEVLTALRAQLPPLSIDEKTRLSWLGPTLDAFVEDGDVGISADGGHGRCLVGARFADGTTAVQVQGPSNTPNATLGCTAKGAVHSQRPPK